jgi:hypothetical protein
MIQYVMTALRVDKDDSKFGDFSYFLINDLKTSSNEDMISDFFKIVKSYGLDIDPYDIKDPHEHEKTKKIESLFFGQENVQKLVNSDWGKLHLKGKEYMKYLKLIESNDPEGLELYLLRRVKEMSNQIKCNEKDLDNLKEQFAEIKCNKEDLANLKEQVTEIKTTVAALSRK